MAQALKSIDATTASTLMKGGALMVDVREKGEYARARIPGSQNMPLSRLEESELPLAAGQAVVFFCASGNRTTVHAGRLASKAPSAEAYVLRGGLSAWREAGLPLETGPSREDGERTRGRGLVACIFSRW